VSGKIEGADYGLRTVTGGAAAGPSGVPHERELLAVAEAMVGGDEAELERVRRDVVSVLGAETFVEAAAVGSNFERMVRIADATGIPLDTPLEMASVALRAELGIDDFGPAAERRRPSTARRVLSRVMSPFMRPLMLVMAARSRREACRYRDGAPSTTARSRE
jgi:hypothetical protein